MRERNYLHANDIYLKLAIGNSPWPIGVTQVGGACYLAVPSPAPLVPSLLFRKRNSGLWQRWTHLCEECNQRGRVGPCGVLSVVLQLRVEESVLLVGLSKTVSWWCVLCSSAAYWCDARSPIV